MSSETSVCEELIEAFRDLYRASGGNSKWWFEDDGMLVIGCRAVGRMWAIEQRLFRNHDLLNALQLASTMRAMSVEIRTAVAQTSG